MTGAVCTKICTSKLNVYIITLMHIYYEQRISDATNPDDDDLKASKIYVAVLVPRNSESIAVL